MPATGTADILRPGAVWASQLWGESLLAVGQDGALINAIASGVLLSGDRASLALSVRVDALFSDGSPVTAGDVVYSLMFAQEQAADSEDQWRFEFVHSVDVIDSRSLSLTLTEPDASLPSTLASHLVPVLPFGSMAERTGENGFPPASGAFERVAADAEQIECRRTATFYQVGRPRLAGLTCLAPAGTIPRAMELVTGRCDLLIDVSPLEVPTLRENPGISLVGGRANSVCMVVFNIDRPVVSDRRVRQILLQAIDRDALVDVAAAGEATPAASLIDPDHWAGLADPLEPLSPQDARDSLAAFGYAPAATMRLAVDAGDPMLVNAAVTLQDQFAYFGVAVALTLLDAGPIAATLATDRWDMLVIQTPYWHDPHELIRPLLVTGAPGNLGGFSSSRIDYLTDLARRARQQEYRGDTYRTIQRIAHEEAPVIPLFYPNYHDAMTGAILNYPAFPPRSARAMHQAMMSPIEPIATP